MHWTWISSMAFCITMPAQVYGASYAPEMRVDCLNNYIEIQTKNIMNFVRWPVEKLHFKLFDFKNKLMSKASGFPKHVLGIHWYIREKLFLVWSKSLGISKITLDFPNINRNKSLGHKFLNELESFSFDTNYLWYYKVKINTITKLKKNPIFSKVIIAF